MVTAEVAEVVDDVVLGDSFRAAHPDRGASFQEEAYQVAFPLLCR